MKMSILMRRKVSALCWARAGWAGAGLPQSAGRSGAATTTSTDNNIATTTTTMSEEHFDQWEHYNFEEKVVRSRNSGEALVFVPMCLLLSLSVSAHKLKFRVGREMKVNRTG